MVNAATPFEVRIGRAVRPPELPIPRFQNCAWDFDDDARNVGLQLEFEGTQGIEQE